MKVFGEIVGFIAVIALMYVAYSFLFKKINHIRETYKLNVYWAIIPIQVSGIIVIALWLLRNFLRGLFPVVAKFLAIACAVYFAVVVICNLIRGGVKYGICISVFELLVIVFTLPYFWLLISSARLEEFYDYDENGERVFDERAYNEYESKKLEEAQKSIDEYEAINNDRFRD